MIYLLLPLIVVCLYACSPSGPKVGPAPTPTQVAESSNPNSTDANTATEVYEFRAKDPSCKDLNVVAGDALQEIIQKTLTVQSGENPESVVNSLGKPTQDLTLYTGSQEKASIIWQGKTGTGNSYELRAEFSSDKLQDFSLGIQLTEENICIWERTKKQ